MIDFLKKFLIISVGNLLGAAAVAVPTIIIWNSKVNAMENEATQIIRDGVRKAINKNS